MKKERLQQTAEIQRIITDYYKQLHGNKIDNLEEMNRFLEKFNLPRLNQEEIEIMNNPITSTEIEAVIKISQKAKAQDQMASQENSIKHLENYCLSFLNSLKKKSQRNSINHLEKT